jgi:hypothetical protein
MFHLLIDCCVDGHVNTVNDIYNRKQIIKLILTDNGSSHSISLHSTNSVYLVYFISDFTKNLFFC